MARNAKVKKEGVVREDGLVVRFTFVNGTTREYAVNPDLMDKFALHGALQKYGDHIAGTENLDDAITELDELHEQLSSGLWSTRKEGTGAGASLLVAALAEYKGKSVAEIKAWFEATGKTAADKAKIRKVPAIAAIIKKLEATRAARNAPVDENEVLSGLD